MKWLIVTVLIFPAIAFSKSYDVSLDNAPVLSESVLEQQRGGFFLPGANFSIGLKMEALVNGEHVFFSNMFNMDRNSPLPPVISNISGAEGLKITPLLGNGKLGYIVENAGNSIRTDVNLRIDVVTPVNINTYRESQRISSRVRDAVRQAGY
ncbi:hypothetical protein GCM10022421_18340 [Oceanisphaera sediminis]|uniref:Curli production assembly/transport component CsgF n=1 Tax=Oceanisphaera sediminis TaxID=981381 RepID=A0ABP7DWW4_9GAMM